MTAEPVSEEPVSGESGEIELFGSLEDGADDCTETADPSRYEVVPFRHTVVLRDNREDTKRAVLGVTHFGTVYRTLPLVEVQGSADMVAELTALPEVLAVEPAIRPVDTTRTIAVGLDWLATIAVAQSEGIPAPGLHDGRKRGEPPGYPFVVYPDDGLLIDHDPAVDWPAGPAILPVINMSLGTKVTDYPYVSGDLVNLATAAASRVALLVVAAGNCGEQPGESMSAWAQPDWVLSVGATEDEAGTLLAAYSSRGQPDDPGSGPDLVAHGRSRVAPHPSGTSYAAPRVTGMAMAAAAAILQLRRIDRRRDGTVEGVPLVGTGLVDSFPTKIWGFRPKWEIRALPIVGVDEVAVDAVLDVVEEAGIEVDIDVSPAVLRRILLDSATPMAGYGELEVGRGFVDVPRLLDHLAGATGIDLVGWFGPGGPDAGAADDLAHEVAGQLAGHRLFDRPGLAKLEQIVVNSSPEWHYDWRRSRVGWQPADLADVSDEQRSGGMELTWPPPFEA